MITYRRVPALGKQMFLMAFIAFEKADDGRVYYAAEAVNRIALHDIRKEHGIGALRSFFASLRAELEAEVRSRTQYATDPAQAIDLHEKPRTYERMCEMLGIEPKSREIAC